VSASEEFPAFPGAAEGGIIPLFAAESGPEETAVSVFFGGVSAEFPQEANIRTVDIKTEKINFFINWFCYAVKKGCHMFINKVNMMA